MISTQYREQQINSRIIKFRISFYGFHHMGTNVPPGQNIFVFFYTHRTQTSTIFIKKSIKMHSVACQLLKKLFSGLNYTPKEIFGLRFTNNNEISRFLEEYLSSYKRRLQGFFSTLSTTFTYYQVVQGLPNNFFFWKML